MVALDQIAQEQTASASASEMARQLEALFGRQITAAILGVRDPKVIARYAAGRETPPPTVHETLRSTFLTMKLLDQVESPEAIRAWFTGMNPLLDDQSPASVMRLEPERVLRVARRFVAEG